MKSNKIPGWTKYVEPKRQTSLFWHNLWRDNGCPRFGKTRAQYHNTIKYVKRNANQIKKEKLAKMLASNQNRDFWKEIKKIRGCNKHLPSAVDSISDSDDIASLFAGKLSALYNSVPCDEELMHNVCISLLVSLLMMCVYVTKVM